MADIILRIRHLQTGEQGEVTFDSEASADEWLRARPRFVDVLGPRTHLDEEAATRLRAALRPLDPEEKALEIAAEHARREALRELAADDQRRAAEEAERERSANKDPARPMRIHWTYDGGMQISEKDDTRPISPETRAAVLAWIAERDDWVKDRGQMVGDARCVVKGGEVLEGQFIPVTAVARAQN